MTVDRSRAARSVLWSVLESGGLALVSFSSLIVYSRFLSAADFGVFSIVLALIELLDVVVSMLFHDALVQREDATQRHFDTAFAFTFALSGALFALCCLSSTLFAHLVHKPDAGPILVGAALRLPCTALGATLVARHRRELAFRALAVRSLIGRVLGAVLGITLVVLGAGVWGLVSQQVLIALTGSLVLWFSPGAKPRLRLAWKELKELLAFGVYAMGTLFLSFSVRRIFTILSGIILGNAAAGYLNLSFRAVDVLWAVAAASVNQVSLPILARLQSDPERLERAYRSATEFTCLLLYPCFVGIGVVAPEVVSVLFGRQWLASSPYVTALALLILVQAPRLLVAPMLTAVGRPRDAMVGPAVELAVMLSLLLTLKTSVSWAVGIRACREIVAAPVMAAVLERATGIRMTAQLEGMSVPLVASIAMGAAVLALRRLLPAGLAPEIALACLIPAGAVSFLVSAWVVGRPSLVRVAAFVTSAAARASS